MPTTLHGTANKFAAMPRWKQILFIGLALLIVYGAGAAFYQAQTMPVIADTVNPGLVAEEIWQHGNPQFYYPVNDPYWFTDYILYAATLPIIGYTASALMTTGWLVYLGIVAGSILLARRLGNGWLPGLLAGALVANAPDQTLQFLVYPVWHSGTTLYVLGALLVFYSRLSPATRTMALLVLQALAAFSDTLALAFLTIPLCVACLYEALRARAGRRSFIIVFPGTLLAIAIVLVKSGIGEVWHNGPALVGVGGVTRMMSLTTNNLAGYAGFLFRVLSTATNYTSFIDIIVPIGIIIGFVTIFVATKDRAIKQYIIYTIIAITTMLFGFLVLPETGDLGRYLFPGVVLILIAIGAGAGPKIESMVKQKKYVPLCLVAAAIGILIVGNAMAIGAQDHDPNAKDRSLASWLLEKNVTHAYADYWPANLLSYIEPGLHIRPVVPSDGKLEYLYLQSTIRWPNDEGWPLEGSPIVDRDPVIITSPIDPVYTWAQEYNIDHPPAETYVYNDYVMTGFQQTDIYVYVYNHTLPAWPIDSLQHFEAGDKPV